MIVIELLIDILISLLEVLFWPAQWWKEHNENSWLGSSPIEKEAERFWLKAGVAGALILAVLILIVVGWW